MCSLSGYYISKSPFAYVIRTEVGCKLLFNTLESLSEIKIEKIDELGKATILNFTDFKTAVSYLSDFCLKKGVFCRFANLNFSSVVETVVDAKTGYFAAIVLEGVLSIDKTRIFNDLNEACKKALSYKFHFFAADLLIVSNVITHRI